MLKMIKYHPKTGNWNRWWRNQYRKFLRRRKKKKETKAANSILDEMGLERTWGIWNSRKLNRPLEPRRSLIMHSNLILWNIIINIVRLEHGWPTQIASSSVFFRQALQLFSSYFQLLYSNGNMARKIELKR